MSVRQIYFVKFSLYSVLLAVILLVILHYNSIIDITEQPDKILVSLLIIAIVGGIYGSYIAD